MSEDAVDAPRGPARRPAHSCRQPRRHRNHRLRDPGVTVGVPSSQQHEPVVRSGALPDPEGFLPSRFWPDRADHPYFQLTASLLQPFVGIVTDRHPSPIRCPPAWAAAWSASCCSRSRTITSDAFCRRARWFGFLGVPSGILARRAHGLGWTARPCPVHFPGRGQRGFGDRAAPWPPSSCCRTAGQRRLVLAHRAACDRPVECEPGTATISASDGGSARSAPSLLSRRKVALACDGAGDAVFEVPLHLVTELLLYLLPDPEIWGFGAERAALSFPLPGRGCGRYLRRSYRRPVWAPPVIWFSILGALPFTLLLPYASLFWTGVLTGDWLDPGLGVLRHPGIRAGSVAGTRRHVAGMFFGFSFGLGGLGAAALGQVADWTSIDTVSASARSCR